MLKGKITDIDWEAHELWVSRGSRILVAGWRAERAVVPNGGRLLRGREAARRLLRDADGAEFVELLDFGGRVRLAWSRYSFFRFT